MKPVFAVIVSYNPDLGIVKKQLSVLSALEGIHVLVIDNLSRPAIRESLHDMVKAGSCELHLCAENTGLGAAYNFGIRLALERGFPYILLLDQDSLPEPAMVGCLVEAIETLIVRGDRVAAVGPRYRDSSRGYLSYFVRFNALSHQRLMPPAGAPDLVPVSFLVSSGMLIDLRAIVAIGLMDESLFIDHVDTEWCFRATSYGYKLYGVPGAWMLHSLGERTVRIWLGRPRHLAVHSPLRNYYQFRNSIELSRRRYVPIAWHVMNITRLFGLLTFYSLLVPPRMIRLKMIFRGIIDGLARRSGRYGD